MRLLAQELDAEFVVDPTITPMLNGDRSILNLGISKQELDEIFHTEEFIGNDGEFCAPLSEVDENVLEGYSCSAGHTLAYISPSGDIYPCVQFPMPCGNLREKSFREIWYKSDALNELRSVHVRDLPTCSSCSHTAYCTRCPGWPTWKATCAGLRVRTARSLRRVREFLVHGTSHKEWRWDRRHRRRRTWCRSG